MHGLQKEICYVVSIELSDQTIPKTKLLLKFCTVRPNTHKAAVGSYSKTIILKRFFLWELEY